MDIFWNNTLRFSLTLGVTIIKGKHQDFNQNPSIIAMLTVTSPIVINVPTRGLLAVETKDSFVLWLAKFKYQKTRL